MPSASVSELLMQLFPSCRRSRRRFPLPLRSARLHRALGKRRGAAACCGLFRARAPFSAPFSSAEYAAVRPEPPPPHTITSYSPSHFSGKPEPAEPGSLLAAARGRAAGQTSRSQASNASHTGQEITARHALFGDCAHDVLITSPGPSAWLTRCERSAVSLKRPAVLFAAHLLDT